MSEWTKCEFSLGKPFFKEVPEDVPFVWLYVETTKGEPRRFVTAPYSPFHVRRILTLEGVMGENVDVKVLAWHPCCMPNPPVPSKWFEDAVNYRKFLCADSCEGCKVCECEDE